MSGKLAWGYDTTNKIWLPVQVDSVGRLKIDMSAINLDDLADVEVPTPDDDDILYWDAEDSLWMCKGISGMVVHGNEYHYPDFASEAALATHEAATTGVHGAGSNHLALAPAASHLVRAFTKGWTSGKYLKGAGVDADPTEYDWLTDLITPIAGEVLRQYSTALANSCFSGLINAGGSGGLTTTNVPYDGDSNEGSLDGIFTGAGYWGRIILYNTTRSNSRKIVSVDIVNNKITTEASTDDWADNDVITTLSPTVGNDFFDVDLSAQISSDVKAIALFGLLRDNSGTTVAGRVMRFHPYTTYDDGKRFYIQAQVGNESDVLYFIMPVYSQKISINYVSVVSATIILTVKGVLK